MKTAPATTKAFTLIETLVSMTVLALIVVLASQMTTAMLSTVSRSVHVLDGSESIRVTTQMLRDELGSVVACERPGRYLNLRVLENEDTVALYYTVPRAVTKDLTRMGFVTHVAYVWDRKKRTLSRAEYHSSRDEKAAAGTADSVDGSNTSGNVSRLQKITPAYLGARPYAWTTSEWLAEKIEQAQRNPLLTDVAEWRVECFKSAEFEGSSPSINDWNHPNRLPVALRVVFVMSSSRGGTTPGQSYVAMIPLPGAIESP